MDRELVESLEVLIRFWQRSAEPWSVKDNKSRYIYANSKFNKLFGLPDDFCVTGRFDSELPTPIAQFSAEYQRQDRQVELLQDRITSVEVHLLDGLSYFTAYFYDKYPLIDENGVSQGVICHGRSVTNLILTRLNKIKMPISLVLMQPLDLFTKREWEVLFYLIHTFSSVEIAKKLGLSSREVCHITQLIYKKVGISNKQQLVEYCYENKISNFVPKSFFEYSGPFPPNLKE
ncbi:helix-turn-helix transcriptional regulator [Yersinia mollaretii]|uniref:helix-turn-helix transcriptional regulator n=1 Tax=Yersinia mollaretii TaxID=33060 RepID=UPI0005DB6FAF|nr:helix-turn-helix transcriptional regulator [Yersinia mollaretii]MDN0111897.1 helix-turn-helix transcriptional regulator [Yersinia mollaretii]PJE87018.1 helix-turn-helix transcriptional regulator [Yersinia mollaretii]CQD40824.1 LuxR family transcription regulatory protein [Yersinia mollaretii]CQH43538.1 LuxR family transcription regulatory protein [Yersinia mollaretii]